MTTARQRAAAVLLPLSAALLALRFFDPATSGVFPPCPLRALTGWYCPGCGSLRAIHQLLLGHFAAAFALNPFAVVALPFLAYGLASYLYFQFRGRHLPRVFIPTLWIHGLAVSVILFGIARNLPLYPLTLLAPR